MAARFVRDEEVVGSNPATPTVKYQVRGLIRLAGRAPEWFRVTLWGHPLGCRCWQLACPYALQVNEQFADETDVVSAVFNSRLGQATKRAASGTAEEILRARDRGAAVHVFFSDAPVPRDHDPDQLAAYKAGSLNSDEPNHSRPGAVLRSTHHGKTEPKQDSRGRIKTRRVRHRLRVENLGNAPAEDVVVEIKPVEEGHNPHLLGELTAGLIPPTLFVDFPMP